MATYKFAKTIRWHVEMTDKVAALCRMFGLTSERLARRTIEHACTLEIQPGDIVFITGPSGAGKTVLLRELQEALETISLAQSPTRQSRYGDGATINLAQIDLPDDKAVIDCIDADLLTTIRMLSTAGLSDVFTLLNRPAKLSEGQQYRFRLAMALAADKDFIFADEFCSGLDRVTAAVIAYNIRKFATRTRTTFILAASQDDFLLDLSPDVLVVKELAGQPQVIYQQRRGK